MSNTLSKMRKVKLNKHCYIKTSSEKGIIANVLSGESLLFDKAGAIWLSNLSYIAKPIDEIVDNLLKIYSADRQILEHDVHDFFVSLEKEGYTTIEECPPFPESMVIALTSQCNEKCVHCYIPNKQKLQHKTLNKDLVIKVINDFKNGGGKEVCFTGGEIFLYQDLMEIIKNAKKKSLEVSLLSNLSILTESFLNDLKNNVDRIQVSLYSIREDIHDIITLRKGSCISTKNNIRRALATGINIKVVCPVLKENWKYVSEVIDFAKALNAEYSIETNITAQSDLNKQNLSHRLTIEELEKFYRQILKYDNSLAKELLKKRDDHDDLLSLLNAPNCEAGYNTILLNSSGVLSPCAGWEDFKYGNINDHSFKEIWERSPQLSFIRDITLQDFKQCVNCEARVYCSHCLACNYCETGSPFKLPVYFCKMAFLKKKIAEEMLN